jgi:hypothetical protein
LRQSKALALVLKNVKWIFPFQSAENVLTSRIFLPENEENEQRPSIKISWKERQIVTLTERFQKTWFQGDSAH